MGMFGLLYHWLLERFSRFLKGRMLKFGVVHGIRYKGVISEYEEDEYFYFYYLKQ